MRRSNPHEERGLRARCLDEELSSVCISRASDAGKARVALGTDAVGVYLDCHVLLAVAVQVGCDASPQFVMISECSPVLVGELGDGSALIHAATKTCQRILNVGVVDVVDPLMGDNLGEELGVIFFLGHRSEHERLLV